MPSARRLNVRPQLGDTPVEELPPTASSHRQAGSSIDIPHDVESEPLLAKPLQHINSSSVRNSRDSFSPLDRHRPQHSCFLAAMEKLNESKVGRFLKKLEVENEDGLTNAQLMLTNHDLKPGTA